MKVRLFGIDEDGHREYDGYFTALGGRVVYYPSGRDEPYSDEQFVSSFGTNYPVFTDDGDDVLISMHDPDRYLKYLGQRYRGGYSWVETTDLKKYKRVCPECESRKVVRIVYGYPKPYDDNDSINNWREKVILGGCMVFPGQPKWACTDCDNWF